MAANTSRSSGRRRTATTPSSGRPSSPTPTGTWARWASPISAPPSTCSRRRGRRICGRRSPPRRPPTSTSAGSITRAAPSSSAGRSPTRSSWRATRSSARGSRRRSCPSSSACSPRRRRRGRRRSGPRRTGACPSRPGPSCSSRWRSISATTCGIRTTGPRGGRINVERRHAEIAVPMYHVTSWYDIFLHGGIANFQGLRRSAKTEPARAAQKLLIGPWAHLFPYTSPTSTGTGEIDFGPAALIDLHETQLRWFDHWLKGVDTGILDEPPVRIFVMGDNRWRDEQRVAAGAHALHAVLPGRRRASQHRGRRRHARPGRPRRGASRPLRLRPRAIRCRRAAATR